MPLDRGTRLKSYEIVSVLGIGGMGEVYRARDLRLQREIALKTLPDAATSDPERRERFRREALAVAALNHPHIVTIHSVEDADSIIFLTMELVNMGPSSPGRDRMNRSASITSRTLPSTPKRRRCSR